MPYPLTKPTHARKSQAFATFTYAHSVISPSRDLNKFSKSRVCKQNLHDGFHSYVKKYMTSCPRSLDPKLPYYLMTFAYVAGLLWDFMLYMHRYYSLWPHYIIRCLESSRHVKIIVGLMSLFHDILKYSYEVILLGMQNAFRKIA